MSRWREIELKLELPEEAATALRRGALRRFGGGPGETRSLSSIYFDTPKQGLRKKGVALRVRSTAEDHIQTVKQREGVSAGLFSRSEWETPVAGRALDRGALEGTPAAHLAKKKHLGPVFETDVERTSWTIAAGPSTVESALDVGAIGAGARSERFAELELELKSGAPADLFHLARQLCARQPMKLGVRTKSERGYALAEGDIPVCHKAEPVVLTRDLTAGAAFRLVAHACLRQFRLNEPIVVRARTVEALHEARVSMRRLRSALSLFKPVVADDRLEPLTEGLRDLSRRLGAARNLDVYIETALMPEMERDATEPGLFPFIDHVLTLREEAYDTVAADLDAPATRRLMLDLVAWIEDGPWLTDDDPERAAVRDGPVLDFAAATLHRRDRTVRRKGRHLMKLDPPARHRVRIAAKKLRYAAEFFATLTKGKAEAHRHAAFMKAMKLFQDDLGHLNDLHTGHELALDLAGQVEAAGAPRPSLLFAAGHLSGEQDQQVAPLLAHAQSSYADFEEAPRFWGRWH